MQYRAYQRCPAATVPATEIRASEHQATSVGAHLGEIVSGVGLHMHGLDHADLVASLCRAVSRAAPPAVPWRYSSRE